MIEVRNLTYSYPGGVPAIRDVSFRLEDGKKYALTGANGAGKSTLLALLCALDLPQGGSAEVDGIPVDRSHMEQIRRRVGLVFQNPDDQLFMPTVYEDVAFGLKNQNLPAETVDARVDGILNAMGISHLKDRPPYRLSGGEKRSAALAAVLAMNPRTLLMDEPTAFLDPRSRRGLVERLKRLDVGMLIATHDLKLAGELADGVLILKDGALLAQGGPELLLDGKLLEEAFLI